MINFDALDFSMFRDVPPPVRFYDRMSLFVNDRGKVSMNRAFLRQVGEIREFHFQMSEDGRYLLLRPSENGNVHFSPKGCVNHTELVEILQKVGIQFPANYHFERYEKENIWVGCSEDLPAPPEIIELLPKKRGRRRRGEVQAV